MKFRFIFLLLWASAFFVACSDIADLNPDDRDDLPKNVEIIRVSANSGAIDWVEKSAEQFNQQEIEVDSRQLFVEVEMVEAGQQVSELNTDGATAPDIWIPDSAEWNKLAEEKSVGYIDCQSVAQSPLVIGLWAEMADLLGYPSRDLGWLDIVSLANDESAWQYYSGGQWGERLQLAHTNPGLSGSGIYSLLGMVQAAESSAEAVTPEQINKPIVQASVTSFQQAVAWYGTNTQALFDMMTERGPSFIGASLLYENIVLQGNGDILPIYPLEGTFMATHPACISPNADQAMVKPFIEYLLSSDGQALAEQMKLRPVTGSAASLPSIEGLTQFESSSVESVAAAQGLWQSARKPLHLVMILDTSGSMSGPKMSSMQRSAEQFVEQMGDDDYLTLIEFAHIIVPHYEHVHIVNNRKAVQYTIKRMEDGGDTALFDAIGQGAEYIEQYKQPDSANAMIILTDGQDTYSSKYRMNDNLFTSVGANDTTVFSMAYGDDADSAVLEQLALGTNGQFFQGDEAEIEAIYQEMSAAFGGSVGVIGR